MGCLSHGWLAKYEMCQSGPCQIEDTLRELGRTIDIDFNLISTEHWEVVRWKQLTSLEHNLTDLYHVEYYF
ncbi:hypothetical protein CEP54_016340 [Fusarium duplospermum]|uniref:Uncharacterized protein n=1 Tax=Fusarium duplospermum TaxID=1325734 RepID=A0A428NF38_9HYPO|nr:hypothetical protein CEP54_016340 [Fusarium duplospermum]